MRNGDFTAEARRTQRTKANQLSETIIGVAIGVHRELGPGLLESAYHACMAYELRAKGFEIECEKALPVHYKGVDLECGYRIDIVVERIVIVELKAVERLHPVHSAQLLTLLKLSGYPLGLMINFNVAMLRDGIKRMVYRL